MDATCRSESLESRFAREGFVVIRGLLDRSEIAFYIDRIQRLAAGRVPWTQPDGVNRHAEFWPLIRHERLLAHVRGLLGPDIRYLPHNDLHLGFSSFSWHRDCVNRDAGVGPDWDETVEPYRLVRVGIYLQRFEESRFRLGLIAGSHRSESGRTRRGASTLARVVAGLGGFDRASQDAEWVATEPGDCVIFDPRILHTGSKCRGPKFSAFVAYGVENSHFRRHWHYYLRLRQDLDYSSITPALAEQLRTAGLLAEHTPEDTAVANAWIPSPVYTYLARRFK